METNESKEMESEAGAEPNANPNDGELDSVTLLCTWNKDLSEGNFQKAHIISFFQKAARKYFEYQPERAGVVKCVFKESEAKECVNSMLSEFILGDNPKAVIEKLSMGGSAQTVCGRVFKIGEPTYSCRECGMDPTCVLCVSCFKLSAHRHHKYKMCTSSGGGCCDCGDVEAWKTNAFCEHHLRTKDNDLSDDITDDIRERCVLAFSAILAFSVTYLEIEANASLECLDGEHLEDDIFCTMLYNDESHTFDQVIQTLMRVTNCPSKEANEIVASVDREGRFIVKCDSFTVCNQLRETMDTQFLSVSSGNNTSRSSQALRVTVLNLRAVACQQFALQLLSWLQEFLVYHRSFRQIFSKVILDRSAPYSVRHILEYDVKLWKAARTSWHRLLISGMLLEYDNKLAFAEEFSRNYATIVQDFISDDHDHSYSIVSLSVQLFTVPSIAHYLIAQQGIFHKLMHTFYHRSIEEFIQNKTLHFSKVASTFSHFRRSTYILYDLRYILSFKPISWSDDLRDGFIEGCKVLLRVLNAMQGMEAITRQTGNHMDYEPEWECAFNIHIKLANAITLIIDWCGADQKVLLKIYQVILRYLTTNNFILGDTRTHQVTVADHTATCLIYDVSSKPVSIHLPLSRFFAGIYLHLAKFGMDFHSGNTIKRTPEELLLPVLCTQVMIAQVNAGMWRRNGYSLLHQLYFYRSARCRVEMLDRDIVGMQIGASMIESNQYLIHILDKFHLVDWLMKEEDPDVSDPDDDMNKQMSMIDEFLELLIVIIGERYVPGVAEVTEESRIRKEIIQLLCIKAYSHSELSRSLPDSNNDMALENVIDSVANFKMPQCADMKGVYELKEELYEEYNMYFYHYTKEEKSKSEENQRARRKAKGELVCCPPPKLPKLTDVFKTIVNLLQCDVMMAIISKVLHKAFLGEMKFFQESHLQKILYLIGIALQEEESGHYPNFTFIKNSQKHEFLGSLKMLSKSTSLDTHRDMMIWLINKFKVMLEIVGGCKSESSGEESMLVEENANEFNNNNVDDTQRLLLNEIHCPEAAVRGNFEKEIRSRLAATRRANILAQMQKAQKSFMDSNAEVFACIEHAEGGGETDEDKCNKSPVTGNGSDISGVQHPQSSMDWEEEDEMRPQGEGAVAYSSEACLGLSRRLHHCEEEKLKCILCFDEAIVSKKGPLLVYLAYVQKSKILPSENSGEMSLHTSSCGHVMHVNCWQDYYNNEENKELRRPRRQLSLFLASQSNSEFLCPYCRCMGNIVIPVTVSLSQYSPPIVVHSYKEVLNINDWMELMRVYADKLQNLLHSKDLETCCHNIPNLRTVMKEVHADLNPQLLNTLAQPIEVPDIGQNWKIFVQQYMKFLHSSSDDGILYTWHSCIYTIEILEMYLRATKRPLKGEMSIRHKSCLSGLIHLSCLYPTMLRKYEIKALLVPIMLLMRSIFNQEGTSVLEWNCFSKMASLILMIPNLLYANDRPSAVVVNGSMLDYYILQVLFLANIVKALLLYEEKGKEKKKYGKMEVDGQLDGENTSTNAPDDQHYETVWLFYQKHNIEYRKGSLQKPQFTKDEKEQGVEEDENKDKNKANDVEEMKVNEKYRTELMEDLLTHIKAEMREFLRCSCLFFYFVTDVELPDALSSSDDSDTFEDMCQYLGLNVDLHSYFDETQPYLKIMELFATHPDLEDIDLISRNKKRNNNHPLNIIPCNRAVPQLIPLPEDYSDLINSVSDFSCPNDEREELKTPTMCLICGEILCGQSYCCQPELDERPVGTCTYHTFQCSAEVGIFLRIRDCQVVYLSRNKGCFVYPPYLDEYGETDMGLRRGNPLRLCPARYSKIHLAWLDHGLLEEIARSTDATSSTGTQWHLM